MHGKQYLCEARGTWTPGEAVNGRTGDGGKSTARVIFLLLHLLPLMYILVCFCYFFLQEVSSMLWGIKCSQSCDIRP